MIRVVAISGSPSASSRTSRLVRHLGAQLSVEGFEVTHIDVRLLPAEDLIFARANTPAMAAPLAAIESATGVVVGTPTYKAAYSGVLKTFLDLLPQRAMAGKVVFPLMTGGTPAHALALDYALRPVLTALGSPDVHGGLFVLDQHVFDDGEGNVSLEPSVDRPFNAFVAAFARDLRSHGGQQQNGGGPVA